MLKRGVKPKNDLSPVRKNLAEMSPLQNPFVNNMMTSPSIVNNNFSSSMNEFGEEVADLEVLRPLGSPGGEYDIFTHYQDSEEENNP